jgi:hypothetical protein
MHKASIFLLAFLATCQGLLYNAGVPLRIARQNFFHSMVKSSFKHNMVSEAKFEISDSSEIPEIESPEIVRKYYLKTLLSTALSAMIGFFAGDILAQTATRKFSLIRLFRFGLFGGISYGAVAGTMRSQITEWIPGDGGQKVVARVALDQLLGTPLFVVSLLWTMDKMTIPMWLTVMKFSWTMWAIAHMMNFTLLPPRSRLMFFNVVQVSYNAVVSALLFS